MDEKLEEKYRALICEYASALKRARGKLKEKEDECRRLKYIVLELTEAHAEEEEEENDAVFDP